MDKNSAELYKLKAEMCKSFADAKRLIIIAELRNSEKSVTSLIKSTGIAQAVLSRQLGILRSTGIVKSRRNGSNVLYSITDPQICEACDIVHRVLLNNLAKNQQAADSLLGNNSGK